MMNGPESRGDSGPFSVANKTRLFCQWVLL